MTKRRGQIFAINRAAVVYFRPTVLRRRVAARTPRAAAHVVFAPAEKSLAAVVLRQSRLTKKSVYTDGKISLD